MDDFYLPGSIAARHALVGEPHVAKLNEFARKVARDNGEYVPLFDPSREAGTPRSYCSFRTPAESQRWSRFISRHNNDWTAGNTFTACVEAGLDYKDVVHWNVIPWWAQVPAKNPSPAKRRSLADESRRAAPYLAQTLELLPKLKSVVLVGLQAQLAWGRATHTSLRVQPQALSTWPWLHRARSAGPPGRPLITCPHLPFAPLGQLV